MATKKIIKKVYFFYIIKNEVDVESEIVEYSSCISMTVFGNTLIHASKNYFTIEEALDARNDEEEENGRYYTYTPVMEGWIKE